MHPEDREGLHGMKTRVQGEEYGDKYTAFLIIKLAQPAFMILSNESALHPFSEAAMFLETGLGPVRSD